MREQVNAARAEAARLGEELEHDDDDDVMRSYCEVCDRDCHRDYVTWFQAPFTVARSYGTQQCRSACGRCFGRVPVGHV